MTGSCDIEKVCKILVIDDDTLVRRTLCAALTKLGYAVTEAPTGQMGMAEFRKDAPDVVITDVMMPDKNGLETISEIRTLNPTVKIIAMSGGGDRQGQDLLELAKDVGAVATLSKPFDLETIQETLDKVRSKG